MVLWASFSFHPVENSLDQFGSNSLSSMRFLNKDRVDFSERGVVDCSQAVANGEIAFRVDGEDDEKVGSLVDELLHTSVEGDVDKTLGMDGINFEMISLLLVPERFRFADPLGSTGFELSALLHQARRR